ncbi:efflux RND transporter permease subunit [Helicobacter pylori]|uniref:efflux RND transporter permease subunit n=1 Tax=Helicobacter pylori TaxID=210 RepID=UPI00025AC9D3|nr:efflux RND transporter permease subunit [Helicobacter pylori]EIE29418.1 cobalt-zinc-cadmium resistance protein [Helicobacter pylori NCTC 11637 = CCUG 17874 = ATCC 43504 = JCM 12093]MBM0602920.1 CusA/CzcA family heavy metal efflux RND transporter [Helicobacter pylori]MBM0610243.1 CusA/CzcA family heavy metal efflux RND transporter [Helicobacter pylori]MBM0619501.1 CusA/CzcA family heavy metal efflux RND transporter [Helicobacter pylori]MBM0626839.1 CusA/CzcA family heavy metal efflux RND tra
MLASIIEFSLRQRVIVIVGAILILFFGTYSFIHTPVDAFPDISPTQVKIILKLPGSSPEEMENNIVRPLELELLGLKGQKSLRSISKYSISDITIDFDDSVDIYLARNIVNERLSSVMKDLPVGVEGGMAPIVTPLSDIFMFTIDGNITEIEKRQLLDFVIRPQLRMISGVADVNSIGGFSRAFVIVPDFNDMARLGVSISDLESAVRVNLRNSGAGRVDRDGETFLVKIQTASLSLEDIGKITVSTNLGHLHIKDFAKVISQSRTRLGFVTKDGVGETTEGLVLSLKEANTKEIITQVYQKLEELKPLLPNGVSINVFYDRSEFTQKAIATVSKTLIEAVVLIIITLFLFLGNLRASVAVGVILPLSLSVAFIFIKLNNLTLNLMSLGGLIIAIGMLIDSAVVVVENAFEKLSANTKTTKLHAIYRSCKEIAVSVVSGVVIIIVFFVPILTLQGLEGKMFRPLAQSIVYALLGTLVLSITIIPVVSSLVLKATPHSETFLTRFLNKIYAPLLEFFVHNPKKVILGAFVFLVASLSLFPFVGKNFMPALDEGDVVLSVETTPSISLDQSRDLMLNIESTIKKHVKEVKSIVARTGSDELGLDLGGLNQTDTFISFIPKKEWSVKTKDELLEKIMDSLKDFKGINFSFTQPIEMRISEMLTGVRGDLAVKIFGDDISALNELSFQIAQALKGIKGSSEVLTTLNEGVNYLYVTPNKEAMANVGITSDEFSKFLKSALEGLVVDVIPTGISRTPVMIRQESDFASSITKIKSLALTSKYGVLVPITSIAKIEEVDGPVSIVRENSMRMSVVRSNVVGRDLNSFVEEAKKVIAQNIKLPSSYYITYGGQFENQQRANKRLSTVIPLSILAIFFILFFTFKSIPLALLILLNIPFAVTGGLIALFAVGEYISVPASVGFIALFGIAVLNGVVMIGYFKELLLQGKSVEECVLLGAKRRLRPVLMTACIAGLGLIPLLFSHSVGSEVQKPLAIVVLGGLVTSSALTLLLLPPMFMLIAKKIKIN